MTNIGSVPTFDLGQDWNIFKKRFSQWLTANALLLKGEGEEDVQAKAVLLSALNDNVYQVVREIIAPKVVQDISYSELTAELDKHFLPKKSVLAERHQFHTAVQETGEDLIQWAARVRQLAVDCYFGAALDEMMCDRFIIGMYPGPERDKLFMAEKATSTLSKALRVAINVHRAKRAARQSKAAVISTSVEVFKISVEQSKSSKCGACGY